jgi:hypothetical protein
MLSETYLEATILRGLIEMLNIDSLDEENRLKQKHEISFYDAIKSEEHFE